MEIIKFEKQACGDCIVVGNFLDSEGVEYKKVDIEDIEADLDFISKYVDMAVPVTVLLDDQGKELQRVIKNNPTQLEELVAVYKGE
jgi:glutaredoxin